MFHCYGLSVIAIHKLSVGLKLVTLPRFHPDTFITALEKHKFGLMYVAPPTGKTTNKGFSCSFTLKIYPYSRNFLFLRKSATLPTLFLIYYQLSEPNFYIICLIFHILRIIRKIMIIYFSSIIPRIKSSSEIETFRESSKCVNRGSAFTSS